MSARVVRVCMCTRGAVRTCSATANIPTHKKPSKTLVKRANVVQYHKCSISALKVP